MALSADRNTQMSCTDTLVVQMAANVKIFGGALVVTNAAGFAAPGAVAATLTYLGRAEAFVDNTGGADGAQSVWVRRNRAFKFANSGADPVVQADMNKVCYIVDDQTVAHSNGGNTRSVAGRVVGIEADGVWIEQA